MAMKETVGSMRAYFILVAIVTFLVDGLPLMSNPLLPSIFMVLGIVRAVLCVGYFVCALYINEFLIKSPGIIKAVIVANLAHAGIIFAVISPYIPGEQAGGYMAKLMVGVAISWYLLNSTSRLSKELQPAEVVPEGASETGGDGAPKPE